MAPLDDKTIYIFIRQDLPVALQLVHVGHACFHLGLEYGLRAIPSPPLFKISVASTLPVEIPASSSQMTNLEELKGIPYAAVIGMPDLNAMNRVADKMRANKIATSAFDDPDDAEGVTCICTEPIPREMRETLGLRKYRLWNQEDPTRQMIQTILGDQEIKGKQTMDALREILERLKPGILDAT